LALLDLAAEDEMPAVNAEEIGDVNVGHQQMAVSPDGVDASQTAELRDGQR